MTYLLDTNAAIALIRPGPGPVRETYAERAATGAEITTSSVVMFELWFGVARSRRAQENMKRLEVFRSGGVDVLAFDEEVAAAAGHLRARLASAGTPIGPYDLLLAGQAQRRELTLVTANVGEFARVPELSWEDWTRR